MPGWIARAAPRGVPTRLASFYVASYAAFGIVLPFWPVWLSDRGLGAVEIGILMALPAWSKVIGNPLFSQLADRTGNVRRVLIGLALASLMSYSLFSFTVGFWPILMVTLLSGLGITAMNPLADALTTRLAHSHGFQYGRVRLWGSVSFMAAGIFGGWFLVDHSADWILILILLSLVCLVAAAFLLPCDRRVGHGSIASSAIGLLANRGIQLVLLSSALIQASHAVFYGFGSLHWLAAGHGADTIGLLWAIAVVLEVLFFMVGATLLERVGAERLLVLAAAAGILRWVLTGLYSSLPVMMLAQMLHALTFAAAHLATVHYLVRHVPPGLAATAQGLYGAVAWGVAFGVTMPLAGVLYAADAGAVFFAMAAMCVVGGVAALMLMRGKRP